MKILNEFYEKNNINRFEGFSQMSIEQTEFLKNIVKKSNIKNVMEIGFNAGHSAETFLSSNNRINLVSFDIGIHNYVGYGKYFIDKMYPRRHNLIIGNSIITVPKFCKENNIKFDIIFIDGGHEYSIAKNDLINCKKLAHKNTIVILDDTINNNEFLLDWNDGPNKVWKEAKEWNFIEEIGTIDYGPGRGQSWGKYFYL